MWENSVLVILLFLFTSIQYTWYFVPSPELKSGFSLVPNWLYGFKAVLAYKLMIWWRQNTLKVQIYCWRIFDTNCLVLYELTSLHSEADFNVTARFWKWCTTSLNKNVLNVAFFHECNVKPDSCRSIITMIYRSVSFCLVWRFIRFK
jgi:hypothetical protein